MLHQALIATLIVAGTSVAAVAADSPEASPVGEHRSTEVTGKKITKTPNTRTTTTTSKTTVIVRTDCKYFLRHKLSYAPGMAFDAKTLACKPH